MGLGHGLQFIRGYLKNPAVVGAVAPSSRALAAALCAPFAASPEPANVLEIGAGTGAVTRYIAEIMRDTDSLDVCELQPDFAETLRRDVLTLPRLAAGVAEGRVRVLEAAVQTLRTENHYDFVICGLPFTSFALRDVRDAFATIRRCLKPGGTLSYFEYVAMRRTARLLAVGPPRRRLRSVSTFLNRTIRAHQFHSHAVLASFPPAHARYLRFDSAEAPTEDPVAAR